MRTAAVMLVVGLAAAVSAAPVPKDSPKATAAKLVGTWKLVKSSDPIPAGETTQIEFRADGTFSVWAETNVQQTVRTTGTWKVEGDHLKLAGRDPNDPPDTEPRDETLTVQTVTDADLVIVEPRGKDADTHELRRVPEPAK